MAETEPKRGRPRKTPAGIPSQPEKQSSGSFFFHLVKEQESWALQLKDSKANACEPDYHRYTGVIRNALREFSLMHQKEQKYLRWDALYQDEVGITVHDPGPRLMELAVRSRLLLDETNHILQAENEEARVQLLLTSPKENWIIASPRILLSEQSPLQTAIHPISCEHVVLGNQVYHCEDLGPYWHEWSLLNADMKSSDLQAYLSLVLSKFPTITLAYEGYTIQNSQPIEASASLFFKEIDAYGYLHILPIIHLESYPPGFFEEQDIIKVVHIDETERRLTLSEVVYPRDPAEEFRAILATMGKETKSAVFEEERHFILEGDFAQKFLSLHMGELISKFSLFQASILSKYKVKFSKPTLKLSLGSGIDYFEGDASISVEQEVFTEAVRQRATAVVVAHNHPSGNLEPSMEDKDVTRRLRQAGDILGIKILDHLIFGEEGFLSMLEGNLF